VAARDLLVGQIYDMAEQSAERRPKDVQNPQFARLDASLRIHSGNSAKR
jgi:hypothetical protein